MDKLRKDWFERFQINFNEAPDGFLGIHAWKKGVLCKYFEIPLEWANQDDFWGMVYRKVLLEWEDAEATTRIACPVCGRYCMEFHLRYKGRTFCRWCGSHYKLSEDGRIVITRSILGQELV
jgi:hypothetical protein